MTANGLDSVQQFDLPYVTSATKAEILAKHRWRVLMEDAEARLKTWNIEPCPIPATDVLRVLQRVADGTAQNVSFDDGDLIFTIRADGWAITCSNDAGTLDGVYECLAPDGTLCLMAHWHPDVDPDELLSDEDGFKIMDLREASNKKPPPALG